MHHKQKLKAGLTLAANSTPIVVRFLCSIPSDPTDASAQGPNPHILRTVSTLFDMSQQPSGSKAEYQDKIRTKLLFPQEGQMRVGEVSQTPKAPLGLCL